MSRPAARELALAAMLCGLGACAPLTPVAKPPAPTEPWSLAARPAAQVREGDAADLRRWFDALPDPALKALVNDALAQNLDLAQARSRVRTARAELDLARAAGRPNLNLAANAGRARIQQQDLAAHLFPAFQINQFQTELSASWELDLFGSVAASVEGARAGLLGAEASVQATQITLTAQILQVYIDLRTLQRRRGLVKDSVASQRDSFALTRSRGRSGLASQIDVDSADNQSEQLDASLWLFDEAIERDLHALAVLAGQPPLALEALREPPATAFPPLPAVPVAIPAQWLRQRPDVLLAGYQLETAAAQLAVARSSYFPNVTLTAAGGSSSFRASDFLSMPALLWSVGAGLTQPLLSGGRLDANRELAAANLEQVELAYRRTVLQGMQDVEDQLTQLRAEDTRVRSLERALRLAAATRDRAADLQRAGLADALSVLQAERVLLAAQDSLEQAREQQQLAQVALFRAMGAGWSADQP